MVTSARSTQQYVDVAFTQRDQAAHVTQQYVEVAMIVFSHPEWLAAMQPLSLPRDVFTRTWVAVPYTTVR